MKYFSDSETSKYSNLFPSFSFSIWIFDFNFRDEKTYFLWLKLQNKGQLKVYFNKYW